MAEYTAARKKANKAWDDKNLDRISVAMPKGSKEALKSHAESTGESVNAFINRAIMEVKEMDNMHRAYQRGLLRDIEDAIQALDNGEQEKTRKILVDLAEDTKKDIMQKNTPNH